MTFIFFFFFEKVGYHSNFDFECNAESGSKESLSIALGFQHSQPQTPDWVHFYGQTFQPLLPQDLFGLKTLDLKLGFEKFRIEMFCNLFLAAKLFFRRRSQYLSSLSSFCDGFANFWSLQKCSYEFSLNLKTDLNYVLAGNWNLLCLLVFLLPF